MPTWIEVTQAAPNRRVKINTSAIAAYMPTNQQAPLHATTPANPGASVIHLTHPTLGTVTVMESVPDIDARLQNPITTP